MLKTLPSTALHCFLIHIFQFFLKRWKNEDNKFRTNVKVAGWHAEASHRAPRRADSAYAMTHSDFQVSPQLEGRKK